MKIIKILIVAIVLMHTGLYASIVGTITGINGE